MPRGEALEVEHKKAAGYLLNLAHKDGESKARFFLRCGFKVEDWESFARALREHRATRSGLKIRRHSERSFVAGAGGGETK